MATGKALSFVKENSVIRALALSPDSTTLVTANQHREITFWDTKTGEQRQILRQSDNSSSEKLPFEMMALAYSPDGRKLAFSHDSLVELYDVAKGQIASRFAVEVTVNRDGKEATIKEMRFLPDNTELALLYNDDRVRFWNLETNEINHIIHPKREKEPEDSRFTDPPQMISMAISPDSGMIATGDRDGTVKIWPVR